MSAVLGKRGAAFSDKSFCLKHESLRRERQRTSPTSRLLLLDVTENAPCASLERVVCPLWVKSKRPPIEAASRHNRNELITRSPSGYRASNLDLRARANDTFRDVSISSRPRGSPRGHVPDTHVDL